MPSVEHYVATIPVEPDGTELTDILADPELSMAAKGLGLFIASRSEPVSFLTLLEFSVDSRGLLEYALDELLANGWVSDTSETEVAQ
ncbi:MAG: hypothetical protein LC721_00150 [Actinobacteria bacterium]|nr:hypothetical protein [Actinomycetota bacterium]